MRAFKTYRLHWKHQSLFVGLTFVVYIFTQCKSSSEIITVLLKNSSSWCHLIPSFLRKWMGCQGGWGVSQGHMNNWLEMASRKSPNTHCAFHVPVQSQLIRLLLKDTQRDLPSTTHSLTSLNCPGRELLKKKRKLSCCKMKRHLSDIAKLNCSSSQKPWWIALQKEFFLFLEATVSTQKQKRRSNRDTIYCPGKELR